MQQLTSNESENLDTLRVWQSYDYEDNIKITITWPNLIQSMDESNPCPTLQSLVPLEYRDIHGNYGTIRYDTIAEFNVDSTAEYTA